MLTMLGIPRVYTSHTWLYLGCTPLTPGLYLRVRRGTMRRVLSAVFGQRGNNEARLIGRLWRKEGAMRRVLSAVFGREKGMMRIVVACFPG